MSDQFVGEIRIFAGNFAPVGWALCNGQLLSISQNTALFSLLGTNYGGDGKSTFGLPDLQGRAPLFFGSGPGLSSYVQGEASGQANVSLTVGQIPAHTHSAQGTNAPGTANSPGGAVWATGNQQVRGGGPLYSAQPGTGAPMNPSVITLSGGGLPHNNWSPYLGVNFIIALQGIFPSRP